MRGELEPGGVGPREPLVQPLLLVDCDAAVPGVVDVVRGHGRGATTAGAILEELGGTDPQPGIAPPVRIPSRESASSVSSIIIMVKTRTGSSPAAASSW